MKKVIDIEKFHRHGKLEPQDIELEKEILGCCLMEISAFARVITLISILDFYLLRSRIIFKAMLSVYDRGGQVAGILEVEKELIQTNQLEAAGGSNHLFNLTCLCCGTAQLERKCLYIKHYAAHRGLIHILAKALNDVWDITNLNEFAIALNTDIDSVVQPPKFRAKDFKQVVSELVEGVEYARDNNTALIGLPSSLKSLTEQTLGYSKGDCIILAAGPAEGKTTLALQEAFSNAEAGHPVIFFCFEMNDIQLAWKIMSSKINVSVKTIRTGKMDKDKYFELCDEATKMNDIPLHLINASGMNIAEVRAMSRDYKRKYKIEMVVIDYLQIVRPAEKMGTRELEVSGVSLHCKEMAVELDVPVIALSQLSRQDKSFKRMYVLSDLRESGAIEQNANQVIFIYRPSYHGIAEIKGFDHGFIEDDAVITVAKSRLDNNPALRVKAFLQFNRFEDLPVINQQVNLISNFYEAGEKSEDMPF